MALSSAVSTLLFDLQALLDNVTGYLLQDESAAKKVREKRIAMMLLMNKLRNSLKKLRIKLCI